MVLKDDDIQKSLKQEQSGSGAAKIEAAERKRSLQKLMRDLNRLIKKRDERGFSDALRRAGLREGSTEWENAWKAYRSC